jgi:hypothetical protein
MLMTKQKYFFLFKIGESLNCRMEREAAEMKKRIEKKSKEKKRMSKEVVAMQREMDDVYRNNERGIKVARILEHIDNID